MRGDEELDDIHTVTTYRKYAAHPSDALLRVHAQSCREESHQQPEMRRGSA